MSANTGLCNDTQRGELILLVHQDPKSQESIRHVLVGAGFCRVVAVNTMRAVVNNLRLSTYNLLITSYFLPEPGVWMLVRLIRSGRFCRESLPILVLFEGKMDQAMQTMVRDLHVRLLSIDALHDLAQAVDDCMSGDPRPSVLIVEDDDHSANLIRDCLEHLFNSEIAEDGVLGLEAYKERRHDLILLDLRLPGLLGEEVLREIHRIDPKQPVIVITAHGSLDAHASLMLDGATDFIPKPFNIGGLRNKCESALRQKDCVAATATMREIDKVVRTISGRIVAADHVLSVGKTEAAACHLKMAIEDCFEIALTDEEWHSLLDEF